MVTPLEIKNKYHSENVIDVNHIIELVKSIGLGQEINSIVKGNKTENCNYPGWINAKNHNLKSIMEVWGRFQGKTDDDTVDDSSLQLIDLFVLENIVSININEVKKFISADHKITRTLLKIKQKIGYKLHALALKTNWLNPVVYVQCLKVARAYMRESYGGIAEKNLSRGYLQTILGKLSSETTFIAHWEEISVAEAEEAFYAQLIAYKSGDKKSRKAVSKLIEAAVNLYDINQDENIFNIMSDIIQENKSRIKYHSLDIAALYLRKLSDNTELVKKHIEINDVDKSEHLVIKAMLKGILEYYEAEGFSDKDVRFLSLPFGFRRVPTCIKLLTDSAPYIEKHLIKISGFEHEKLALNIYADCLENILDNLSDEPSKIITLSRIIDARNKIDIIRNENLEADLRNRLMRYVDYLSLSTINSDNELRSNGINGLLELASEYQYAPIALLQISKDIEKSGPIKIESLDNKLAESLHPEIDEYMNKGNHVKILELAAGASLGNVNLTVYDLGGRSGVTTIGDYNGMTQETLSYKKTTKNLSREESGRIDKISKSLAYQENKEKYNFSPVLNIIDFDDISGYDSIAVRKFIKGNTLRKCLQESPLLESVQHLKEVAIFLAKINNAEYIENNQHSTRKDIWKKEFGRWLDFLEEDRKAVFDCWWSIVEPEIEGINYSYPILRRDAHIDNWLITEDGNYYAIDLEAKGYRPLGYELAQLTDDHNLLPVQDWKIRKEIFDSYYDTLNFANRRYKDIFWTSYQACVLSRITWALTEPNQANLGPLEAERKLEKFVQTVDNIHLKGIAISILEKWMAWRSLISLDVNLNRVDGSTRIKTSKEISWHLRHNKDLQMDSSGWVEISELADQIRGVDENIVSIVTTDTREQRFMVKGTKVRAMYGHTIPGINPDGLKITEKESVVYHATPWINGSKIIDEHEGLNTGARNEVHLTNDINESIANGMRMGHPIILTVATSKVSEIKKVSQKTFLAPAVPCELLGILPTTKYWNFVPAIKLSEFHNQSNRTSI